MIIVMEKILRTEKEGHRLTLQVLDDDDCRYCVRYRGQGRYFVGLKELASYLKEKWDYDIVEHLLVPLAGESSKDARERHRKFFSSES